MAICIIGGGPAGLSTALTLRNYGFDVTLLEASTYDNYCAGEHLVAQGIHVLETLNLPNIVWENNSVKCYEIKSAWGESEFYSKDSIFNPYGEGVLLSRPAFDRDFAEFIKSKGVNLISNARVAHLQRQSGKWLIQYNYENKKRELITDFVIDASSRNTKFASVFGVKKIKYDNLIGITIFCSPIDIKQSIKGSMLIEAVEKGWWYSTVLKDDTLVATFMTDANIVKEIGSIEKALQYFVNSSNEIKRILSTYKKYNQIHAVSAKSQILSQIAGENWLAVGDSAWSADPLSSQGIFKAVTMGMKAAEAINELFSGNSLALKNYENYFRKEFHLYIKTRAKYYRMETRWCGENFWKRRQRLNWLEIPITIDPFQKINVTNVDFPNKREHLKSVAPSIDMTLLSSILESSTTAFDAISNYKRHSSHNSDDREIIIAVQELMDF